MTRALIVTGVLGLGTVLVFGAAMVASVLFPNGGTVSSSGWWGGTEKGMPMPAPAREPMIDPDVPEKGFVVEPVEPRVDLP